MTDLPVIPDPALWTVLMTVILALGASSLIAGWSESRFSRVGCLCSAVGAVGLGWVGAQEGFGVETIPAAFVDIVARMIR